ncbi:hypothetical protein ACQKNC_06320 [Lysinibacillus sp. NPDC094177]|uniref:hypothetical protein n=1 Tax=Lysinibacillus sp. NPDC094177 TaxID=3390580 RepID=UPI003D03A391
MLPAHIEVNLDKVAIRQYIKQNLNEVVREVLWLVDIDKMADLKCMSPRWLEEVIICDVRMKTIEIKKNCKRWWPYRKAFGIISEITSEW